MKPAQFDYYAPTSVAEALENLAALGYSGKVLAGGQSLIPAMNFRMARPAALVDINNIPELAYIKPTPEGGLAIGAMTRDAKVESDPLVTQRAPLVPQVMKFIAHQQIRNRGSFGGSLAHADPAGQNPSLALVIGAKMKILKKGGERIVPAEEFFMGPFMTVIEPDELLAEIVIPPMPARAGWSYHQVSRQKGGYAQAAVVVLLSLDERGRCNSVRLAIISVGDTPGLSPSAVEMLVGKEPTAQVIQAAADKIADTEIDPGTDIHATAAYRRNLVRVLVKRALTEAFDVAKQRGG